MTDKPEAPRLIASGRARVLIVDDEERLRSLWSDLFTTLGYDVEAVPTGVAGVAATKERRPDAMILDWHLPGGALDGPDVLKEISREIPVIVVTGDTRLGLFGKTIAEGAFTVLEKPVDLQELARTVGSAVAAGRSRPQR